MTRDPAQPADTAPEEEGTEDEAAEDEAAAAERAAGIRRCLLVLVLAVIANAAMWAFAPGDAHRMAVVVIAFLAVSLLSAVLAGYLFFGGRNGGS